MFQTAGLVSAKGPEVGLTCSRNDKESGVAGGGMWGFDEEEAESEVTVPGDVGPDRVFSI